MKFIRIIFALFLAAAAVAHADTVFARNLTWADLEHMAWPKPQDVFKGFSGTVRDFVWETVYGGPGEEIYCARRYTKADTEHPRDSGLTLEHAYPAKWAAQFYGYRERTCLQKLPGSRQNRDACRAATGDPHNLWPADASANSSRRDYRYGRVEDKPENHPEFAGPCPDFLRSKGADALITPPAEVRGDVARSIVYMHFVYDVPTGKAIASRALLLQWMNGDQPSDEEERREREIRRRMPCSWNPLILSAPTEAVRWSCADD